MLKIAKREIEKEMKEFHFIDDSDGVDNLYELAKRVIEEVYDIDENSEDYDDIIFENLDDVVAKITKHILKPNYKTFYKREEKDYFFFYECDVEFDSLRDFYKYFKIDSKYDFEKDSED